MAAQHSATITQTARGFCQEGLKSGATDATGALYADLAKALFARFYGKLLIPRLGT